MSAEEDLRRVFVLDADAERGSDWAQRAEPFGFESRWFANASDAWAEFGKLQPTVILAALVDDDDSAETFLRNLQTSFMGTMPRIYFSGAPRLLARCVLEPDGLLVPPFTDEVLGRVLRPDLEIGDTAARQINRLRDLYELTMLNDELVNALDILANRTSLTFRVTNCVVWGPGSEPFWPRMARTLNEPDLTVTAARCRAALEARVAVVTSPPGADPIGRTQSYLAAPLGGRATDDTHGGICLIADGARLFSTDERDALRALGTRLGSELTYVSAHLHLVKAHERLRETALLDPLLSVWTRAAFERTIVKQISASRRRGESLHLAVIDFVKLRAINDRYGHLAGDAVLAHLARNLREHIRAQDHIGRYGGDELAVLLVGASVEDARAKIESLLAHIETTPFELEGLTIPLRVTIGMTTITRAEVSGEQGFARALNALRRARRAHKRLGFDEPQRPADQALADSSMSLDAAVQTGIPSGSTLGGMYRIFHEINRGAVGVVYRAEDMGLGRPVAIKVLLPDLASDRALVARFRDEAAVLASLHHRHLVQVYSFGEDGDDVFFVMELVEGEALAEVIDTAATATERWVPIEWVIKIVGEVADALDAMHSAGLIHRDVKPENVLLDRKNDRAVLVDVGVAKRAHEVADAAGTPGFAAPESFTDRAESPATDVYGLATTSYAMLTGGPPFGGAEIIDVVNAQLFDDCPVPSEHRPGLPEAVDVVMARALDPDPDRRYASATELAEELAQALTGRGEGERAEDGAAVTIEADLPEPAPPAPDFEMPAISMPPTEESPPSEAAREPVESAGLSRGAFFFVARQILEHQLGVPSVRAIANESASVAEALDPDIRPSGWHRIEALIDLLNAAATRAEDGRRLARHLGRSAVGATLAHTFGADPTSVAPVELFRASETYWPRYHRWGTFAVEDCRPGAAAVRLEEHPASELLCAVVEGMLARIPELAGATHVAIRHTRCRCRGHDQCRFLISWDSPAPVESSKTA